MNLEKYKDNLLQILTEMFADENSGHDIYHLQRVYSLALHIQEKEGGDKTIVGIASLLHDVHRLMQNKSGKYVLPKDSLDEVKDILKKVSFPEEYVDKILHCVEYHEEYSFTTTGKTVTDLETLILQDADNLDAIGAIGIGRAFAYDGAHRMPMWKPEVPFNLEGAWDDTKHDPSTIHHIHHKLLKLNDNMNTETAKNMAKERHRFMEMFAREFIDEWEGRA